MKAKLEALERKKLKHLAVKLTNKPQQHNKHKQEQKVHKQITQATTS